MKPVSLCTCANLCLPVITFVGNLMNCAQNHARHCALHFLYSRLPLEEFCSAAPCHGWRVTGGVEVWGAGIQNLGLPGFRCTWLAPEFISSPFKEALVPVGTAAPPAPSWPFQLLEPCVSGHGSWLSGSPVLGVPGPLFWP